LSLIATMRSSGLCSNMAIDESVQTMLGDAGTDCSFYDLPL